MKSNGLTSLPYQDITLIVIKWHSSEIYQIPSKEMNNNGNNGMIEMIQKIHLSLTLLNVLLLIKKLDHLYLCA
jgi:hypothetical protein